MHQFRLQLPSKPPSSSRLINLILLSSSLCVVYLLFSIVLFRLPSSSKLSTFLSTDPPSSSSSSQPQTQTPTSLSHIVFGIASNAKSWPKRRHFVRLWWAPHLPIRGCVFLDSLPKPHLSNGTNPDASLSPPPERDSPPLCVSEDTSRFKYTCKNGLRSAVRVARVVAETVALSRNFSEEVRWFVFGDDDTVFFPENLARTLGKYDHNLWYYIGTNSEIYEQNRFFWFEMAFGGAGFAISRPLAEVLSRVFDSCLERYHHLYGSDGRIYSCLAELGVGLTREPGFHQMDFLGDAFGYLASHPITPLVSLHHLDYLNPIFPNKTATGALAHLLKAVEFDSQRILQQTVCYDRWFSWTISVSWGYAVQVIQGHMFLPDVLPVQQTFRQWKKGNVFAGAYNFNTKQLHHDPCRRPTVFFFNSVSSGRDGIVSIYKPGNFGNCTVDLASPKKLEEVRVFSKKLDLSIKQLQAPRRQCCDVLPSSSAKVMEIGIRECGEEEPIKMLS